MTLAHELATAAAQDLQPYEHLHKVRILGKQLRYAMEIFGGCYDAPFRDVYYPAVEQMQEILGLANDSYGTCQRLTELRAHVQATRPRSWRRFVPGIEAVMSFHERRLPRQRQLFERWWSRWRRMEPEVAFACVSKPVAS